jgi:hypothetical protein
MYKAITLFFFAFFLSACMHAQTLMHSEILGRPTDHGMDVHCIFSDTAEVCIQYGTSTGTYPSQTQWKVFPADTPAVITVSGLQSDTKYFYRLCYRKPGDAGMIARAENAFRTKPPAGKAFTFIVQADPHMDSQTDTALYRLCLRNQLLDQPDFMVDLGDFLMTDKLKNTSGVITDDTLDYRCNLLRSYYETSCHSVPLFIALGNHEGEAGWYLNGTAGSIAVRNTLARKKYFPNPFPNQFYSGDTSKYNFVGQRASYYSWTWGDALFVVLDPYWHTTPKPDALNGWRWTLGKAQYEWLRKTLEKSDAKFKFVFSHQLVGGDPDGRGGVEFADRYEWGGNNLDSTWGFSAMRPGWYKPIKDLLTENRVTVFFHGHDHFYGQQEKDCLIYQETPQPGHFNFTSAGQAATYGYLQGVIQPNSGHLRVNVDVNGVKVDYVRAYLPKNENAARHNRDVSSTYYVKAGNCYDTLSSSVPVLYNRDYSDELVYPNPFMEQTNIRFNVASSTIVSIVLSDVSGKTVRHLVNGYPLAPGQFQVSWDGVGDAGTPLPDGIYAYNIHGNGKMMGSGKIMLKR